MGPGPHTGLSLFSKPGWKLTGYLRAPCCGAEEQEVPDLTLFCCRLQNHTSKIFGRVKWFPSNIKLKNIYGHIKTSKVPKCKLHNVWHPKRKQQQQQKIRQGRRTMSHKMRTEVHLPELA
jgi:hypothetical protein